MKPRVKKLAPFVPLTKDTMRTKAWKAMSHGARSLYAALKGKYNTRLQNAVYLSSRDAKEELGSHSNRRMVMRWFREIEYYGFTRMVSPAHYGLNGHGKAPHWRLTEESYLGQNPTRDFLRWDGEVFHEQKSPAHYKNRTRGADGGATLVQTGVPVEPKYDSIDGTSGADGGAIWLNTTGADACTITSLTTPLLPWSTPTVTEVHGAEALAILRQYSEEAAVV